jgi:hypothetical protein
MGLKARKPEGSNDIEPIAAGVHQAICIRYYDLGTHHYEWNNKEISSRKVLLMWEVPDERIEIDGRDLPRALSKEYTLSLHKKAKLRSDLESWRGKGFTDRELEGFDLDNILGKNCMLNVVHNETEKAVYANIASVMPLMKSMEKKQPENQIEYFSFDDAKIEIPDNTPEWIITKIKDSDEWAAFSDPNYEAPFSDEEPPPPDDDGEIPF